MDPVFCHTTVALQYWKGALVLIVMAYNKVPRASQDL